MSIDFPIVIVTCGACLSDEDSFQISFNNWIKRAQIFLDAIKEDSALIKWLVKEQINLLLAANKKQTDFEINSKIELSNIGKIRFILQNDIPQGTASNIRIDHTDLKLAL